MDGMRLSNSLSKRFPHGGELAGQPRQGAKVNAAFIGAVEIAAARGEEAKLLGHVGVGHVLGGCVTARHHFHALTAVVFEFGEERKFFVGRKAIARRVGDDRHAFGMNNPLHRVFERGPAVGYLSLIHI